MNAPQPSYDTIAKPVYDLYGLTEEEIKVVEGEDV
jgi:hypothetical protein